MATSIVSTGFQFPDSSIQTTAINYSWLTSNLFNAVTNCGGSTTNTNCIGTGDVISNVTHQLVDGGNNVALVSVNNLTNCNCNCDCACTCD